MKSIKIPSPRKSFTRIPLLMLERVNMRHESKKVSNRLFLRPFCPSNNLISVNLYQVSSSPPPLRNVVFLQFLILVFSLIMSFKADLKTGELLSSAFSDNCRGKRNQDILLEVYAVFRNLIYLWSFRPRSLLCSFPTLSLTHFFSPATPTTLSFEKLFRKATRKNWQKEQHNPHLDNKKGTRDRRKSLRQTNHN